MSNKNLFKEAIADAKAVREAALANAKAALEEALTPRLQSMLSAKLNEMEENLDEDTYEEGFVSPHDKDHSQTDFFMPEGEESLEEEFDISEILAELYEDYSLEEAEKDVKKKKMGMNEADDEEESEEDFNPKDPKSIKDFIIATIEKMMDKEGTEEPEEIEGSEETETETSTDDEEEINLEELLAELDEMGGGNDDGKMEEGFMDTMRNIGKSISKQTFLMGSVDKVANGQKVSTTRQDRQKDWDSANGDRKALEKMGYVFSKTWKDDKAMTMSQSDREGALAEREMNEAIRTINTLRRELNEVNLLNAKLLYVNKIFKAKNLTESQKLKVIASFDKATTTREAKVVYESLNSTLTTSAPKQAIKESLGFASRAAGVAPRKAIVESNDVIARMQKLANIIK